MENRVVKDMTSGSPIKLILGFFVPMVFGLLFQQLYNMVDTIIVGKYLGVNALAAVGSTGSINYRILYWRMQWVCHTSSSEIWREEFRAASQVCCQRSMAGGRLCGSNNSSSLYAVSEIPAVDEYAPGYYGRRLQLYFRDLYGDSRHLSV